MKTITKIILLFTLFIISFSACPQRAYASNCQSEIIIEKNSRRVLYSSNENLALPIASTTKIVTAITVIDNFDIEQEVTIPKECVGVEGSSIYLKEGERYKVKDLLYGLMLRSGNDCAEALAITLSKSRDAFVELMNGLAKKCGATNSCFTNPHGLHDQNHKASAYDLAVITAYAMKNGIFKQIVSSKTHTATELTTGEKRVWVNKNKMLAIYEGATGVKTGFTVKAGRCLVSSAEKENMEIISVVLNCPDMFNRSCELLDYGFENYNLVKVIDKEKFNYKIPLYDKSEYYNLEIRESFYYPIKKSERIHTVLDIQNSLKNRPQNGEKVGQIKIFASKQLIFSQNIYTLIND